MNKLIFFLIFLSSIAITKAQVGINTQTPIDTLDVNGATQIRAGVLKLGPTMEVGNVGDVIMSKGPDNTSVWTALDVQERIPNQLYLVRSIALSDYTGVILEHINENNTSHTFNSDITNGWTSPSGLKATLEIEAIDDSQPTVAKPHQLNIEAQMTLQLDNTETDLNLAISFSVGIFIDNKLKAVRSGTIVGRNPTSFTTFTVKGTIDNLSAGEHQVKIAVMRRASVGENHENIKLYCGITAPDSMNMSAFMAHSVAETNLFTSP